MTRRDFTRYLQSVNLNLQERFPGVYAVGWNLPVPHHELPEFERKVRQDRSLDAAGYPDFRVHPLNTLAEHPVVTYLQPMEVNRRMNPQVRDHPDNLRDSTSRMLNLIENLLSFAQVDQETLRMGNVDLQSVARKVLVVTALSIRESDATICVGELPVLRSDQDQLETLLTKLLSNAIKYRDNGRARQVHVQATLTGDYWKLSFFDNRLGIPSHLHDKVFEPVQRLNRPEESVGTELGLSICRQIVSSLDGRIWIDSSSDAGTTLTVSIPVCAALRQAA